jgi:hypothetical protein
MDGEVDKPFARLSELLRGLQKSYGRVARLWRRSGWTTRGWCWIRGWGDC